MIIGKIWASSSYRHPPSPPTLTCCALSRLRVGKNVPHPPCQERPRFFSRSVPALNTIHTYRRVSSWSNRRLCVCRRLYIARADLEEGPGGQAPLLVQELLGSHVCRLQLHLRGRFLQGGELRRQYTAAIVRERRRAPVLAPKKAQTLIRGGIGIKGGDTRGY